MTEPIHINLALPPNSHPAVLSAAGTPLARAMGKAYSTWGALIETADKLDADAKGVRPTPPRKKMTNAERVVFERDVADWGKRTSVYRADLARAAQPKIESALTAFDQALKHARTEADKLRDDIQSALVRGAANQPIHIEIRSRLGKSPSLPTLQVAVETGDPDVLTAILGSPAWLLGITDKNQAIVREIAAKKFAGEQVAALDSLESDVAKATAAREAFVARTADTLRSFRSSEQALIQEAFA